MCLIIQRNQPPVVAENDIICYKHGNLGLNYMRSAFLKFRYVTGKLYMGDITVCNNEVGEGFHSFKKMISAYSDSDGDEVGIYIIPKGSLYYDGRQHNGHYGYASNSIIYMGWRWNPLTYLRLLWRNIKK